MSDILVVDDRSINREFLTALLGYAGHSVREAADGRAALEAVRHKRPMLIISDVMMPLLDGLEMTRELRADPATSDIPIIFYTATYRVHEARTLAQSCGVSVVLPKPSEPQAILDAVTRVLAEQRMSVPGSPARDVEEPARESRRFRLAGLEKPRKPLRVPAPAANTPEATEPALQPPANATSLRLAATLELGLALSAERDRQALLDTFCRAAQEIVHVRYVGIVFQDGDAEPRHWSSVGPTDAERPDLGTLSPVDGRWPTRRHRRSLCAWLSIARRCRRRFRRSIRWCRAFLWCVPRPPPASGGWCTSPTRIPASPSTPKTRSLPPRSVRRSRRHTATWRCAKRCSGTPPHCTRRYWSAGRPNTACAKAKCASGNWRKIDTVFFLTDANNRAVYYVSPAYEAIWGRSCQSLYENPEAWADLSISDDDTAIRRGKAQRDADGRFDMEYRIRRDDGALRWIHARGFPITDEAGTVVRIAGIADDITERREQERKISRLHRIRAVTGSISSAMIRLRDRHELFQEACRIAVTESVFAQAWVVDVDRDLASIRLLTYCGGDRDQIQAVLHTISHDIGARALPFKLGDPRPAPRIFNAFATDLPPGLTRDALLQQGFHAGATFPLFVEGKVDSFLVLLSRTAGLFDQEEVALLDWMTADLSFALEMAAKSERLSYLAFNDVLTGLPNVRTFHDRLQQMCVTASVECLGIAVVLADIMHFTQFNETYGRAAGDALLRAVGKRLEQRLPNHVLTARVSADTFAFADFIRDEAHGVELRNTISHAMHEPYTWEEKPLTVAVQLGIALFPTDNEDAEALFKNADSALKQAKTAGEPHAYYSRELQTRMQERRLLEEELRVALEERQFIIHYQPRVDLTSGAIVGAEALIRWRHPVEGLIGPGRFIPVAEETGLITRIGEWIINAVCAQLAAWQATALDIVPISVNLSSHQLSQETLFDTICAALQNARIEGRWLELELTESAVMANPNQGAEILRHVKQLGCTLALDDFGTGYSSLGHLKHFPFDTVKIDRMFITDITCNAEDAAIANAVIAMSHRMGLKVVAEGVETEGQLNYLRHQRCDQLQGHYFSPGVAQDVLEGFIRQRKRLDCPTSSSDATRTLLVVDDEQGVRSALVRILRRDGYRVLTAEGGKEGLELLATNAVQVIISDQRMPNMSGTEFLHVVRQLYPDTVRIILSGYADLGVVTDSVNRGAVFKFLTKPWEDDLLREQVREAFRLYRPATDIA
ncbi:EAL domain-containing protein [Tahibacter amnicola]|uniref:EAL domain-containing protein n=1 Tax=Tahibacter amnicola TaxID=2976241 RepID=A0ABY6BJK0_9GAMM|nr:EAL domain-containing protein [Tahibacter amnicola]UXI70203.1 EAL domain-containing protein [Tahibacter amnicola]